MGACQCTKASTNVEDGHIHPDPPRNMATTANYNGGISILDEFGFLHHPSHVSSPGAQPLPKSLSELTLATERQIERMSKSKWKSLYCGSENDDEWIQQRAPALLVEHGYSLPADIRARIWMLSSGAAALMNAAEGGDAASNPAVSVYKDLLKHETSYQRQIDVDVPRTLSDVNHCWFKAHGEAVLGRILHALAVRLGQDIGYVQGMNMIVATALIAMDGNEIAAFWTCVSLMETRSQQMCELYRDGLKVLIERMTQLDLLIESRLPRLHQHFRKMEIYTSMFASPWFLTLFSYNLPFHQSIRLFDVFFVLQISGPELVFRFALSYLELRSKQLRKCTFEGVLELLSRLKLSSSELECALKRALEMGDVVVVAVNKATADDEVIAGAGKTMVVAGEDDNATEEEEEEGRPSRRLEHAGQEPFEGQADEAVEDEETAEAAVMSIGEAGGETTATTSIPGSVLTEEGRNRERAENDQSLPRTIAIRH